MCCVLSYMWQQNGEDSILRKPELDAFLATGNTKVLITTLVIQQKKLLRHFVFS